MHCPAVMFCTHRVVVGTKHPQAPNKNNNTNKSCEPRAVGKGLRLSMRCVGGCGEGSEVVEVGEVK